MFRLVELDVAFKTGLVDGPGSGRTLRFQDPDFYTEFCTHLPSLVVLHDHSICSCIRGLRLCNIF